MRGVFIAIASLALAQPAFAQSAEHMAAVERAAAIGWDLYEHDQAAWHGTDRMLADVPDPRGEGFRGYITERTADGVQLLFIREADDRLSVAYRALYRDGAVQEHGRAGSPLTEAQTRIFRARRIVTEAPLPQQCAPSYNTVTLPRVAPSADGVDVDVYMMPAMASLNEVPFGGHFRFGVDTAAGVVREIERFTNGCITIPKESNTAALWISQIIGETPTEVHVFESLTASVPVYVTTSSGLWSVEGREIRYGSAVPEPETP